jgi:hypothetical protein
LLIFRGDHLTVAPVPVDRLFIGRHRRAHIRIGNPDVNLKHAVLERVGVTEKFRVVDFSTSIPTLVNGEMIEGSCAIDYGDQIEIADVYIYFDRVRKDAPEEHRVAFDNLVEVEKAEKGKRFQVGPKADEVEYEDETVETEELTGSDEDGADDGEADPIHRRGRGRRRRRTGLKSNARRRRNAKGL